MKYSVKVPYCGYAYVEVEADSEEEAIQVALETENLFDMIEEGDFYEQLVEGNIFNGCLNEAEVEELEDEDEDWEDEE
jgi:hypothetical protein